MTGDASAHSQQHASLLGAVPRTPVAGVGHSGGGHWIIRDLGQPQTAWQHGAEQPVVQLLQSVATRSVGIREHRCGKLIRKITKVICKRNMEIKQVRNTLDLAYERGIYIYAGNNLTSLLQRDVWEKVDIDAGSLVTILYVSITKGGGGPQF